MRRTKTLAAALLLLAACGDAGGTTTEAPGATTTTLSPTSTSIPQTTSTTPTTTTPTTTAPTTTAPPPAAAAAVRIGICMVGVSPQGEWLLTRQALDPHLPLADAYRELGLTSTGAAVPAEVLPLSAELLEGPPEIFADAVPADLVTSGGEILHHGVYVGGDWDPFPRPVVELDPSQAVYRDATAEVLADLGFTGPPVNRTILRFDIEGDGVDEVLVHATTFEGRPQQPDDYSVLYLRRLEEGEVRTSVLRSGEAVPEFTDNPEILTAERSEIETVADVNGDGILELIESWSFFESSATVLWENGVEGFAPVAECGAGV